MAILATEETIIGNHQQGWIGVDLDGTYAYYDYWRGAHHIGTPIPKMLERIKKWRKQGTPVRIFTARIAQDEDGLARRTIDAYNLLHVGEILPITCKKDYQMIELWDDRAVQVRINTGERVDGGE